MRELDTKELYFLLEAVSKFTEEHLMKGKWSMYQRVVDFIYDESKKKSESRLWKATKKIFEYSEKELHAKNLTLRDVDGVLVAIMETLFDEHKLSRNLISYDIGSLNGNRNSLELNINLPKKEDIFHAKKLNPAIPEAIIDALKMLEEKYEKNTCELKIRLNFKVNISHFTVKIQNEMEVIGGADFLEIIAKYKGSFTKCEQEILQDISLIRALLEFGDVIYDPQSFNRRIQEGQMFPSENDCTAPDVQISFQQASLSLQLFKARIENTFAAQKVVPHCMMHLDYFKLLKKNFERKQLQTAIYFFNNDSERLPSFRFLKYWFALETMLVSDPDQNKKSLLQSYALICPLGDTKEFERLYKMRCDFVHDGKLHVSSDDIGKIESLARNVFSRLFSIHEYLRPI